MLYFFSGNELFINDAQCIVNHGIQVAPTSPLMIQNGDVKAKILVLQGRPIGEPVARYGPFVMNTQKELQQAYFDYQQTQFGGWPWESRDPTHGLEDRFAVHSDGTIERI
jgi:redox-sensitive bicupin YhaK (pirin superfamily)